MPRSPSRSAAALVLGLLAPLAGAEVIRVPQDAASISEAVAGAVAGDRIVVAPGTYSENVVVDVPGLELQGRGAVIDAGAAGSGVLVVADGVTLSGLTVRNGLPGIHVVASDVTLSRNRVEGCLLGGVLVTGDGALIERNTVSFCEGDGIRYTASTNGGEARLERNHVSSNTGAGLSVEGGRVLIERNEASWNGSDGIRFDGGAYGPTLLPQLSNNRLDCNGRDGVRVVDTGLGVLVERNRAEENARHGLAVLDGPGALLVDNDARGNVGSGLWLACQSSTVRGNVADGNGLAGVHVEPSGDGGLTFVEDNRCQANGRDGILVRGSTNLLIGNVCQRNVGDGIDLDVGSPGNVISRNTCRRNGHEGIDNSGQLTQIRDNRCDRNGPGGVGIDIAGTGNDGAGSVSFFDGNRFDTGGQTTPQALDL